MNRIRLDELRAALPDLDELQPVLDGLLGIAEPDSARAWSGSGELGTFGSWLVDPGPAAEAIAAAARSEAERLAAAYTAAADAMSSLAQGDRRGAARRFLEAAASEESQGRADRALAWTEAAWRAVEGESDRTLPALALRRVARALRSLGRLEQSLQRYERSHEMAREMGDLRGAAEAAVGAGNVLEQQGRWTESEAWYRAALAVLDEFDGPASERWHALLNLHIVARSRGALEESLPLLEQAEAAAIATDGEATRPFLENARGQLLMARGEYEEAEAHFRAAVHTATHAPSRVAMRANLAESFLARGYVLEAATSAREAEREAIRSRAFARLPEVYRLLGRIRAADEDPDAFVFFERALELVRDRGLPALEEALTLQAYAESEAQRGEAEVAEELRQMARERFVALGITRERQRWADVFGPPTDNGAQPQEGP